MGRTRSTVKIGRTRRRDSKNDIKKTTGGRSSTGTVRTTDGTTPLTLGPTSTGRDSESKTRRNPI